MNNILEIDGKLVNGKITPKVETSELADIVMNQNKVVIIKDLFNPAELLELRKNVIEWGRNTPPVTQDDFRSNYHSLKAKVSNIQKTPHVFHDYNFNDFKVLPDALQVKLSNVFESLRLFYNELTGYSAELGIIENEHYFHPQLIHYPLGGGFFGRHNHNLLPQKIGFILSLSKYGEDYESGGTCFVINDEVVDIEGHHNIGDLCLFRFDIDHWVKQTPLNDKFYWDSENGRWTATLAYFNPFG